MNITTIEKPQIDYENYTACVWWHETFDKYVIFKDHGQHCFKFCCCIMCSYTITIVYTVCI